MLHLAARYGSEFRDLKFYADKYFKAFPMLDILDSPRYGRSRYDAGARVVDIRFFRRFTEWFGFVEIRETTVGMRGVLKDIKIEIRKTALLDDLFQVRPGVLEVSGEQSAEALADADAGEKIATAPDALLSTAGVVAELRVVERQAHELGERDRAAWRGLDFCTDALDELGVSARGHGDCWRKMKELVAWRRIIFKAKSPDLV